MRCVHVDDCDFIFDDKWTIRCQLVYGSVSSIANVVILLTTAEINDALDELEYRMCIFWLDICAGIDEVILLPQLEEDNTIAAIRTSWCSHEAKLQCYTHILTMDSLSMMNCRFVPDLSSRCRCMCHEMMLLENPRFNDCQQGEKIRNQGSLISLLRLPQCNKH